jgi:hypothetical protein
MNTFPQPGQQNFQQFAGQAPVQGAPPPQQQQFAPAPQQFGPPQGAQPQQFAPAPQQGFAQPMAAPAQNYGPGPAAAQPLAAPGVAFGPGAFDSVGLQGHQDPTPNEGDYILEVNDTVLKTQNGRTHVTTLTVIEANQATQQAPTLVGSVVGCPQKLDGSQWSFKYGTGAILAMTMAMTGFTDEVQFKTQIPAWSPLLNAMCDNKQQLPGNPWPANPLKGRRARCAVRFCGKYTKSGNKPIMNFNWSVLA